MKVLKWVLLALGILLVIAGAIYGGAWYENRHPDSITSLISGDKEEAATTSTSEAVATTPVATDENNNTPSEYKGWLTYTNKDVGYTLKYPQGWTVKETNGLNETIGTTVKYIVITSADSKYFLALGLKKKTDTRDFGTSDRTGMGAGEYSPLPAETFVFLGDNVIPNRFVWEGKNKEFFFRAETKGSAKFTGDYTASFSPNASAGNSETLDMPDSLLDIPILIMRSVSWL